MKLNYDQLIIKIGEGDMQALETLYDELYAGVYAFLLSMVQDTELSADLAQDTFLQVYYSASGFHSRGLGRAWVLKIARNLAINALKRGKRESYEMPLQYAAPERGDALYIKQSLSVLTPSERKLVMLKAYGYSHKEIAVIVSLPAGTVRWKYASAIKKLKGVVGLEA